MQTSHADKPLPDEASLWQVEQTCLNRKEVAMRGMIEETNERDGLIDLQGSGIGA